MDPENGRASKNKGQSGDTSSQDFNQHAEAPSSADRTSSNHLFTTEDAWKVTYDFEQLLSDFDPSDTWTNPSQPTPSTDQSFKAPNKTGAAAQQAISYDPVRDSPSQPNARGQAPDMLGAASSASSPFADVSLETGNLGAHRCQHCLRPFRYPKDLRRHELTHTGSRDFKCPVSSCEYSQKGSSRSDALSRHMRCLH